MTTLNVRATARLESLLRDSERLRVDALSVGDAKIVDCGVRAAGGLNAGLMMAEICLAGMAEVAITTGNPAIHDGPWITVRTDHPVSACMASQYAGWEVKGDGFFGMGSGPMRAAAAREALFEDIGCQEQATACVGALEASELPPVAVCQDIAEKCGIATDQLTLLVAPTNSQAGNLQVVARSVETALHKLHELKFDLSRIESAWGSAPLPPVAGDALGGIGRTNDAILYGGHAVLHVRGDEKSIAEIGPQTPSSASADHGKPFAEVFAAYDHDFYKIDPGLFSPAVVTFVNLDTGQTSRFGRYAPEVLEASFN